uniref:Transmembrane protein 164-like n=1 Tax=Hirondellea gigas TaxID=1518452 RepID=A0A6A7G939_9CRUS
MGQFSRYTIPTALDWSYGGVNSSIPGNGGPECAAFLTLERRLLETVAACCLSIFYTCWSWRCMTLPAALPIIRQDRGGKRLLLVIVSLIFGMEIGFKFATKQLIYLLNPCHMTTALQIYLLAAPPSRFVTVLFRIHINYLNGAALAMLFPVTNSRLLPAEEEVYWIQHTLMFVTPYYLLRLGGVYTIEPLRDFSWSLFSTGLIFLYHFLPLQAIALAAEVNLNNMLCPAISDPFYGPHYRLVALLHQSMCIPFVAKTFCALATFFLTCCPLTKMKDHLGDDVSSSSVYKLHCTRLHNSSDGHHGNGAAIQQQRYSSVETTPEHSTDSAGEKGDASDGDNNQSAGAEDGEDVLVGGASGVRLRIVEASKWSSADAMDSSSAGTDRNQDVNGVKATGSSDLILPTLSNGCHHHQQSAVTDGNTEHAATDTASHS